MNLTMIFVSLSRSSVKMRPGGGAGGVEPTAGDLKSDRGSPTPRNSPKSGQRGQHHPPPPQLTLDEVVQAVHQRQNSSLASSGHSTLTRQQINQVVSQLQQEKLQQEKHQQMSAPYEPRIVMPVMKKSGDLGVRLVRRK